MIADALLADQFTSCSDSLCSYLRRYQAKSLARMTGAAVATAEGWQEGKWPQSRHMVRLAAELGQAFLDAAYGPVLADAAPLAVKLARVEDEIKSIRKEIEDAGRTENAARAAGGAAAGGRRGAGAAGAKGGWVAAAQRGIALGMTVLSLWGPVQPMALAIWGPPQPVASILDDDDDDWARFFRSRGAARGVRMAARRDAA